MTTFRSTWALLLYATFFGSPGIAQTFSWTGDGITDNWSDDDNWGSGGSPNPGGSADDALLFIIDAPLWASINDLADTFVVNDLFVITSGVNATLASLEGNPMQFDGTGRRLGFDGGGALAISNPLSFSSGTATTVDVVNTSGGNDPTLRLNGNLTGSGHITKTGGGRLVLDGNNGSWGGSLNINEGVVLFQTGDALSNTTTVFMSPGVTADFTPEAENFGALHGAGTVLIASGEVQAGFNDVSTTFSGQITGTAADRAFTKAGVGDMLFVGAEVNVSRLRSRGGGELCIGDGTQVTADLIDAIENSTFRITHGGTVFATAADFSGDGIFELVGGNFFTTVFDGVLLNQGGTLSPGTLADETRILPISGNFNNSDDSTLQIDIGGPTPGEHDQLSLTLPAISGSFAGLGGTLDINLVDGFVPSLGDTFTIVEARSVGGTFDVVNTPIFEGLSFDVMVVDVGPNEMSVVLEVVEAVFLPGDYNDDGIVNAADYVVWRNNEGTTITLPNDPLGGTIGAAQYDQWRGNFGRTSGSGSFIPHSAFPGTLWVPHSAPVPEPATVWLLAWIAMSLTSWRKKATLGERNG